MEVVALENMSTINVPYQNALENIQEYRVAIAIILYGFPVVVCTGTIGNILSFIVLVKKRMRNTSVYFYLAVLALADTCVLFSSAFRTWIRVSTDFELLHVSWVGCKTLMFIFMVTTHLSAWLVVAMTTDRFIVVWFPLRANRFCDVTKAWVVTGVLLLVICLYKLHLFWTIDLLNVRGMEKCASESIFMQHVYPLMKLASYTIIPFVIVLVMNSLTTYKLWQSRKSWQKECARRITDNPAHKLTQYRITLMLLTVSFVWLLLTAPFTVRSLMESQQQQSRDPEQQARAFLIRTLCFLLMYLNHGINFVLYCLTGNKFRSELAEALCLDRCKSRRNGQYRDVSLRTTKSVLRRTNSPWEENPMASML